jgi:hypothetical protein
VDYCGAYELMKHDKLKKECFEGQSAVTSARSRGNSADHTAIALMEARTGGASAVKAEQDRTFYSINNAPACWSQADKNNESGKEFPISEAQLARLKIFESRMVAP